eukprot:5964983-Pleurochrysis_carterae.AAC.1
MTVTKGWLLGGGCGGAGPVVVDADGGGGGGSAGVVAVVVDGGGGGCDADAVDADGRGGGCGAGVVSTLVHGGAGAISTKVVDGGLVEEVNFSKWQIFVAVEAAMTAWHEACVIYVSCNSGANERPCEHNSICWCEWTESSKGQHVRDGGTARMPVSESVRARACVYMRLHVDVYVRCMRVRVQQQSSQDRDRHTSQASKLKKDALAGDLPRQRCDAGGD